MSRCSKLHLGNLRADFTYKRKEWEVAVRWKQHADKQQNVKTEKEHKKKRVEKKYIHIFSAVLSKQ